MEELPDGIHPCTILFKSKNLISFKKKKLITGPDSCISQPGGQVRLLPQQQIPTIACRAPWTVNCKFMCGTMR